ncbi:MAG: sulfurtransferase [Actinomycetes bacterium]
MIPPVVDVQWLAAHPEARIVDVRWYLDGRSGRDAWCAGHLPGASFVDLDAVLAAPASHEGGRHPLPEPETFAAGMRAAGIGDDSVVVAYDDAGGASASRLVWLLRICDVDAAVLDGGLAAWPGELEAGAVHAPAATFTPRPWDPAALATIDDAATGPLVLDARAAERYRGDDERLDARAGHIPGAVNLPYAGNLAPDGSFLAPDELARRFAEHGITDALDVVVYCGSGVTACHDLIALEHAGLGRARLYPGSWSQYAATDRPIATGPEPGSHPGVDALGRNL